MSHLLIKNGVVVNSIIAGSPEYMDELRKQYDDIIEIKDEPGAPGISWKYDGKEFAAADPVEKTDKDFIDEKVDDISFAKRFLAEFSVFNDKRKLSDDDRILLSKEFAIVRDLLLSGDTKPAIKALQSIKIDGVIFTDEIVADLSSKLMKYLSGEKAALAEAAVEAPMAASIGEIKK